MGARPGAGRLRATSALTLTGICRLFSQRAVENVPFAQLFPRLTARHLKGNEPSLVDGEVTPMHTNAAGLDTGGRCWGGGFWPRAGQTPRPVGRGPLCGCCHTSRRWAGLPGRTRSNGADIIKTSRRRVRRGQRTR